MSGSQTGTLIEITQKKSVFNISVFSIDKQYQQWVLYTCIVPKSVKYLGKNQIIEDSVVWL